MDWHLANLWEIVSDSAPEAPAVTQGERRITWAEYDRAAARLAAALGAHGVGASTAVGIYMYNCPEYLVTQFAAFKCRGVAVNVNYRYLDDELVHLLDDAECEALVFHASLAERVERIAPRLPRLGLMVSVDDGVGASLPWAADYGELVDAHEPAPRTSRPGDDIYMLYTGGTTGMPKGAMYHQADMARSHVLNSAELLGLAPPDDVADVARLVTQVRSLGLVTAAAVPSPLMHGMGMWGGAFRSMATGGSCNLLPGRSFDPHELWRTVERHRCTDVVIVGDPFARPMLSALDEAQERGQPYDVSSLRRITSSGATWSAEVKSGLLGYADAELVDNLGATEGGMGVVRSRRGSTVVTGHFGLAKGARVLNEAGRDVVPGSGEAGLVHSPSNLIGYHRDPEKTARTVRVVDGVRYVVPGDWVTVEEDGSIGFLGRGSGCINTAGEKVFPEEVEEAIKRHPEIVDCLVVGLPDERFGEQVTAVASCRPGSALTEAQVLGWLRERLSGYKVPRRLVFAEEVRRAPNGKADYPWARRFVSDPAGERALQEAES